MSKSRSGNKWKLTRHDMYYKLAKEQGYRSRASFKLIQLNKKFNFLGKSKAVLDLCAAPGGWLQVCQKFMPANSLIVGVDLLPIRGIPDVVCLQEDITSESCRVKLKKEFQGWQLDAVIHDGAPDVGGAQSWAKDAYMQNELVIHSLKLATVFLREGGIFITKVFRSQDYNALLWVLKQFFKKCTVTKPAASRDASAEIFVVCEGYLAPKKIDPRLLDPACIFKQDEADVKRADVFHAKPGKRNREGYADDTKMIMSTVSTVSKFVEAADPIDFLGTYNSLDWDDESKVYLGNADTNDEIKHLVTDLKVLGKGDFSFLLKWRKKMLDFKKELLKEQKAVQDKDEESDNEPEMTQEEKEEMEEAQLDDQLKELRESDKQKVKKEKKKKKDKLNKERRKRALNENNLTNVETETEMELFKMTDIKDKASLDKLHRIGHNEAPPPEEKSEDDDDEEEEPNSEDDPLERMEADMDAAYELYRERRKIKSSKKLKVGLKDEEEMPEVDEDEADQEADADDDDDDGTHALGAHMPPKPSKKDILSSWFDRDLFAADDADEADTKPKKNKAAVEAKSTKTTGTKRKLDTVKMDQDENEGDDEDEDDDEDSEREGKGKSKSKSKGGRVGAAVAAAVEEDDDSEKIGKKKGEDSFEEVPVQEDFSSDSDAQAETLAMGQLMLRKRSKNKVLDDSYNRYSFKDDELPEWFLHDEGMHNKPQLPVTKSQVAEAKAALKAINSRSIKRVAEAKARKKMKAFKQYEKAKEKAVATLENDEAGAAEKSRAIQKMYSKKKIGKEKRLAPKIMVSQKGGGVKQAKRSKGKDEKNAKRVDKRQKKEMRMKKANDKKRARGSKTNNKKKHRV